MQSVIKYKTSSDDQDHRKSMATFPLSLARAAPTTTTAYRLTPSLPMELLQDLCSVHHLLRQHPSTPTLAAELASLETFCAVIWGLNKSQQHITFARQNFGRPELNGQDLLEACTLAHGADCVYRNKGCELYENCVERVKRIDQEIGRVLENCCGYERFIKATCEDQNNATDNGQGLDGKV